MSAQPLTHGGMLEEFRAMLRESGQEFDKKIDKLIASQAETDRQMRERQAETDRQIGNLGNRIGDIVECMVGGNIVEKFQDYDYNVTEISRNIEFGIRNSDSAGQIDVLLDDGDVAILVEVKTKPTTENVHEHINRLEKYRRWKDSKGEGKKRYIGAIAGTVVDDNVMQFAQKKGMFVIVQLGNNVEIVKPPEGFKPKEW
jgi:hypothetical protein